MNVGSFDHVTELLMNLAKREGCFWWHFLGQRSVVWKLEHRNAEKMIKHWAFMWYLEAGAMLGPALQCEGCAWITVSQSMSSVHLLGCCCMLSCYSLQHGSSRTTNVYSHMYTLPPLNHTYTSERQTCTTTHTLIYTRPRLTRIKDKRVQPHIHSYTLDHAVHV